jgi:hypothetical protein
MNSQNISQKKLKLSFFRIWVIWGLIKNLSDLAQKVISARSLGPKTSPKISTWLKNLMERYRVRKFLHIHTYIHTDISPILIFLSSWDPKTSKTIKNSKADFYAKTLLSPYWEKVKVGWVCLLAFVILFAYNLMICLVFCSKAPAHCPKHEMPESCFLQVQFMVLFKFNKKCQFCHKIFLTNFCYFFVWLVRKSWNHLSFETI